MQTQDVPLSRFAAVDTRSPDDAREAIGRIFCPHFLSPVERNPRAFHARHHTVEQQLCRWLLMSLDRLSSNELIMTQELIANMLGVRREGVTEAARRLQQAGLIQYTRGHITVLDRPALEAWVCECYEVVQRESNRLLPLGAKTAKPRVIPGSAISQTLKAWEL